MQCDLCGKDEPLVKAIVEGATLSVCSGCSSFGKVLASPVIHQQTPRKNFPAKPMVPEIVESVMSNAGELVKAAREKRQLRQIDLAMKIAERESLIQKIESNTFHPPLELAKKLEKALSIVLIEKTTEEVPEKGSSPSGKGFTLGDILNKIRTS